MSERERRGLSPVIATVLLISIALVIALIIFLWVKNFVGEKVLKLGEPVENSCDDINFDADAFGGSERKIFIANKGNVPIYQIQVRKIEEGSIETLQTIQGITVGNGQSVAFDMSSALAVDTGDEIEIVPVIIGETETNKETYPCVESSLTRIIK